MRRVVLVVDDARDIHALLDFRLASEGVTILHAYSAAEGLALARAEQPDLVLLDVEMPDRSGFEVCRELKASPTTEGIAVVFLTASTDSEAKVAGLDLGAIDFVTKPFDPSELRARVRAALRTKALQDQLVALAHVDPLTRLWNRTYFEERLRSELANLPADGLLSVVVLDVDALERVNDLHGHLAGDAVLRGIALRLPAQLRAVDVSCRWGGGKIALLLPGLDRGTAVGVAEQVRVAVASRPFDLDIGVVAVTASLGVASTDDRALAPGELLARAGQALHDAKRRGKNRVVAWRPLRAVG